MATRRTKSSHSIGDSVAAITAHLKRLRRPAGRVLQPGLSRKQIKEVAGALPFALHPDLVTLYSATNGTHAATGDDLDDLHFFPGFYLLSLKDAVAEYLRRSRSRQWNKGWFPVFANGGGDYYAVSRGKGGIIGFMKGEPDQPVEYTSLAAMLETIDACYDEDAFFVKKGSLEIDDDEHRRIAMERNPGLAFWEEQDAEEGEAVRNARGQTLALEAARLLGKKKPHEALAAYEQAIEVRDHDPSFYVNALYATLAANKQRSLEPQRIRKMLKVCLAQKRRHADVFLNAAFAWMLLGEKDECIAAFREAKRRGVVLKKHLQHESLLALAGDKRFIALQGSRSAR